MDQHWFQNTIKEYITGKTMTNLTVHSPIDNATLLTTSGQHKPLVTLQLNNKILLKSINIDSETGNVILWRLILNPGGLNPNWSNINNSLIQYSIIDNEVEIGSNSVVLLSGYTTSVENIDITNIINQYGLYSSENVNTLTLSVEYVRGHSRCRGVINFVEINE